MAVQLAVCGVQALDRIRRVDDGPDICGKLEDRGDDVPVTLPAFHGIRIFLRPFFCDPIPIGSPLFLIRGIVDRFEVVGEGLTVFVRHILQGVADLMDDAALVFRLWESGLDRLTNPGQSVSTDDQDVFHSAVLKAVEDGQPVLGALVIADLNRQDILFAFAADSQDNVGRHLPDDHVVTDGVVDRVDVEDGVDVVEGPVLPVLDLW